jgi:proline dehydrogenase
MGLGRNILLWASKNDFLKNHATKWGFVQKAVKKFMPGETVDDAIEAAKRLIDKNIPVTFTHLGENINNLKEAEEVVRHYLTVLEKIYDQKLDIEISLKLTQLGFDISYEKTLDNFKLIAVKAAEFGNSVWIDIEDSSYADKTIKFYKDIKPDHPNIGICLQAYLYRTEKDLLDLITINPSIRLVKGAYKEGKEVAYPEKKDVDKNYFNLAKKMLELKQKSNLRMAFGTHDVSLVKRILNEGARVGLEQDQIEIQMLYGIKSGEQERLTKTNSKVRVLISYGEYWYPWYVRRLAERPANVWFVAKNIFN